MTDNKELGFKYDLAEGPQGLKLVLEHYLQEAKQNPGFAKASHYVLYELGEQQSLIRVNTNEIPFHFKYCDLYGRPATMAVKDTIAKFLWEKCGENEKYNKEELT